MVFYYNRAGWVANMALLINLFFLMGVLAAWGAVLTLPGIAGIVLTIGMAVDANVLIYERMREEQRSGKSPIQAIQAGFERAWGTIIRSEEHTSELQSLMRISYAVFCLKKQKHTNTARHKLTTQQQTLLSSSY